MSRFLDIQACFFINFTTLQNFQFTIPQLSYRMVIYCYGLHKIWGVFLSLSWMSLRSIRYTVSCGLLVFHDALGHCIDSYWLVGNLYHWGSTWALSLDRVSNFSEASPRISLECWFLDRPSVWEWGLVQVCLWSMDVVLLAHTLPEWYHPRQRPRSVTKICWVGRLDDLHWGLPVSCQSGFIRAGQRQV